MQSRHIQGAGEAIASSPLITQEPKQHCGAWDRVFGSNRPLEVEVGIGRDHFIMEKAPASLDINYIGVGRYSSAPLWGLQRHNEMNPENIYFMCIDTRDMMGIFAPGKMDRIYLNFPDPWPKNRRAKRRLTSSVSMPVYNKILVLRGVAEFKTDNRGFFEYPMESIPSVGWGIIERASDLHNSTTAEDNMMIEYEMRFISEDKPICKLIAR